MARGLWAVQFSGFTVENLGRLVLDGLATATPGTMNAGRPIKVTWLTITDVAHAKAELIINFAGVRRRFAPSPSGLRSGIVKTSGGRKAIRRGGPPLSCPIRLAGLETSVRDGHP
jgi:hypothetical protein